MARGFFESLLLSILKTTTRSAIQNSMKQRGNGDWECPQCGRMKTRQAVKHNTNQGLCCTQCFNKGK